VCSSDLVHAVSFGIRIAQERRLATRSTHAGLLRKASSSILISLIHVFIEIQARRFGEAQTAACMH
jgi:hypothetical protein